MISKNYSIHLKKSKIATFKVLLTNDTRNVNNHYSETRIDCLCVSCTVRQNVVKINPTRGVPFLTECSQMNHAVWSGSLDCGSMFVFDQSQLANQTFRRYSY